jgi:hypothetical protein
MQLSTKAGPLHFVASGSLALHPVVYYGSSHSVEGIQVADLIAGVRRRSAEGDANLVGLDLNLSTARPEAEVGQTSKGRPYTNLITVFWHAIPQMRYTWTVAGFD